MSIEKWRTESFLFSRRRWDQYGCSEVLPSAATFSLDSTKTDLHNYSLAKSVSTLCKTASTISVGKGHINAAFLACQSMLLT